MFVLGVDPGLSRCGYGCVRSRGGAEHAIAGGVLTTDPEMPLPRRLATFRGELLGIVNELAPDVVVVERVFFQTNVRTAMSVGQASGVALVVAEEAGCQIVEYTANEVKLAVAGYGAASKDQVRLMVSRLLGLESIPGPADVSDAFALALCHLAHARIDRAVAERPTVSELASRPA